MNKTKVGWIESARSLAMIAVVFNHGFGQDVFDLIGKSSVFLFFFLSAYFVPSDGRKIVNRMIALVISYLLWNSIYGAVELYVFHREIPPETFLCRFFGVGKDPFNPPFWFLRDLILFHFVWYLLQWAGRHASWLSAVCLIVCWIEPFRNTSYIGQTCPYWMTPFLLGLLCRTLSVGRLERCLHPAVVLPAAVFFVWCAVHYERGLHPAAWMSMAVCGTVTMAATAFYVLRFDGFRKALYFVLPPPPLRLLRLRLALVGHHGILCAFRSLHAKTSFTSCMGKSRSVALRPHVFSKPNF